MIESFGHATVIHCHMGIGRSSLMAAAVLIHLGKPPDTFLQEITKARGLRVPDTALQEAWVKARGK